MTGPSQAPSLDGNCAELIRPFKVLGEVQSTAAGDQEWFPAGASVAAR